MRKKRHTAKRVLQNIPNVIKFRIISFLFPCVYDFASFQFILHKQSFGPCLHAIEQAAPQPCCFVCGHLYHYNNYETFLYYFARNRLCLNCAYFWVRFSNFLNPRELCIRGGFVHYHPNADDDNDYLYSFDRISGMIQQIQEFHNRHFQDYVYPQLDIMVLYMFGNVDTYLDFLERRALYTIENVTCFRHQRVTLLR